MIYILIPISLLIGYYLGKKIATFTATLEAYQKGWDDCDMYRSECEKSEAQSILFTPEQLN